MTFRAFRRAIGEFDDRHLPELDRELHDLERQGLLTPAGLTGEQLDFKVGLAARNMEGVGATTRGRRGRTGSKRWRKRALGALGKVKVVLGSLKGLSRWVEGLIELVEMTEKAIGE